MVDAVMGRPRNRLVRRVAELRAAGVRTALVSNQFREWEPVMRPLLPWDELFDEVVYSYAVGIRKPDSRIYELTLDRLGGIAPAEAVLLDDLEVNLIGARSIGMQTILVGADDDAIFAELDALVGIPFARG